MQKLPITLALASLVAVVAVAKTQKTEQHPTGHQSLSQGHTRNPFPDEVRKALAAEAVPRIEAEKKARALLHQDQLEAAEVECRRAVALAPLSNGKPWYSSELSLLGTILLRQGRNEEALKYFLGEKFSSRPDDPQKPRPHMMAALAYCRMGNFEMAKKYCPDETFAAFIAPEHKADWPGTDNIRSLEASILFARGLDEDDTSEEAEAFKYYKAALKLAPTNWLIAETAGWALDSLKRYDEAIPYYRLVIEKQGDKASYETRMRVEMHDRRNQTKR